MFDSPKIGIIGLGFVGSAIKSSMDGFSQLVLVDPLKGFNETYKDLTSCQAVFVCVPSPMMPDGSCDSSILKEVLAELKKINYDQVIISKVTAPPDVYEDLQKEYKNLVYAPEFLTANNARLDYINSEFLIIGGEISAYRNEAERIIRTGLCNIKNTLHCSIAEASLIKYTVNSFLATKVIFMNEIHNICKKMNYDYNKITESLFLEKRIGAGHTRVPGPDGQFGFGGACFPKDTEAFLKFAYSKDCQLNVLDAAVKKNILLRLTDLPK